MEKEIYMKKLDNEEGVEVKFNGKTHIAYDWTEAFNWVKGEEEKDE